MRAAGKMRHTKKAVASVAMVSVNTSTGRAWRVPQKEMGKVDAFFRALLKRKNVSTDEAFADLYSETSKPAVMLRASRNKAGMTQTQLAEKLGVRQPDIANMENGRRAISKAMAKKLADVFETDYRVFL